MHAIFRDEPPPPAARARHELAVPYSLPYTIIICYHDIHTADDEETGRGARDARPVGGAVESNIDGDTRRVGTSEQVSARDLSCESMYLIRAERVGRGLSDGGLVRGGIVV